MFLEYCKHNDQKSAFIKWELDWMYLIFETMTSTEIKHFLNAREYKFEKITLQEKETFKKDLLNCRTFINVDYFDNMEYYKTNFVNIISLVKKRKVFLNKGYAYFPFEDMFHLISCTLYRQFSEQLDWNSKMLPNITNKDNRIKILLSILPIVMPSHTSATALLNITFDDLEDIYQEHYPLCMKHIHNVLKSNHHLKHDCRMQYGIFLKNLGLPLEDTLKLFEEEFTKKMPKYLFDRKYAYYFKHYYGKVGGLIDYKPYTCKQIQEMVLSAPDHHHGCPFKHWDKEKLLKEFEPDKLRSQDIADIEDLILKKNYQQACIRHYWSKNKLIMDSSTEGPNEYCANSYNLVKNLDELLNDSTNFE